MAKPTTRNDRIPLIATTFRLPADIVEGLAAVKERDGTPIAQQVQRALRAWLTERKLIRSRRRDS